MQNVSEIETPRTRYAENAMTDDRVGIHVPTGVAVAAAVLGVMAFVGLLLVACTGFGLFMTHTALVPHILTVRVAVGVAAACILAIVILAVITIF